MISTAVCPSFQYCPSSAIPSASQVGPVDPKARLQNPCVHSCWMTPWSSQAYSVARRWFPSELVKQIPAPSRILAIPAGSVRTPFGHTLRSLTINPSTRVLGPRPKYLVSKVAMVSSLSSRIFACRSEISVMKVKRGDRTMRGCRRASDKWLYLFFSRSSSVSARLVCALISTRSVLATRSFVFSRTTSNWMTLAPARARPGSAVRSSALRLSAIAKESVARRVNPFLAGIRTNSRPLELRMKLPTISHSEYSLAFRAACRTLMPVVTVSSLTSWSDWRAPCVFPKRLTAPWKRKI